MIQDSDLNVTVCMFVYSFLFTCGTYYDFNFVLIFTLKICNHLDMSFDENNISTNSGFFKTCIYASFFV